MSLNRILKHVRSSWRTLAICAVAGLILGGLATLIQEPTYEATSTVLVSPNGLGNVGPSLGADAYFIAQRAQSYVEVATAPQVLKPAGAKAGLDQLTEGQVTVTWLTSAPANLDIAVTAPTAREAAAAANAVAERLAVVVDALERPRNGGNAAVRVNVARSATTPHDPVSPDLIIYLLVGLVAGLAIGFPLVLGGLLFRRGISDAEALSEATGEAPLGVIGAAPAGAGLILRDAGRTPAAEAFRKLRTSVQFAKPDAAARSIVVSAPRLGAGSTTVAANLALAAAEAGRKVVLVDGNLRAPAMSELFRLKDRPGLANVLAGDADLTDALQQGGLPGLTVLTAGNGFGEPGSLLAGPSMVKVLEELEAAADLVIIDAPPVLPYAEAAELAAIADAALLVARYRQTNVDDLQQARATLAQVGTTVLGVVINGVPERDRAAVVAATQAPGGSSSTASKPELADHPSP